MKVMYVKDNLPTFLLFSRRIVHQFSPLNDKSDKLNHKSNHTQLVSPKFKNNFEFIYFNLNSSSYDSWKNSYNNNQISLS